MTSARSRLTKLFILACVVLRTQPAQAQEAANERAIVVTASRTDPDPPGQTVIDTAEVKRFQSSTLLEVLGRAAGLRAVQTGGIAGSSFLSVRGGEPNFTLVEIDGFRVNDPSNSEGGGFDFAQLAPSAVSRVVIVRGSLSAIHGSDSLSGLVSLQTRAPVDGGRLSEARGTLQGGGAIGGDATGGIGWSSGAALVAFDVFDSSRASLGSTLKRRQLLASLRQTVGPVRFAFLGLHSRTNRDLFPQDSGGPLFATSDQLEIRRTQLDLIGFTATSAKATSIRPRARFSWSRQRSKRASPGIAPGFLYGVPATTDDTRFTRLEGGLDLSADLSPFVTIAIGGTILREAVNSRGIIDIGFPLPADFTIRRTTYALFAEATIKPSPNLVITGALRNDIPSTAGSKMTARASFNYTLHLGGPVIFASASTGFKLPSLFSLAYPLIANPALLPERSVSFELGATQRLGNDGAVRVTVYKNRFQDLIDFDPALFTNVNRARVDASGVELEFDWSPTAQVTISTAIAHLRLQSTTPLRGRPEWTGNATLTWHPTPAINTFVAVSGNDELFESSVPTGLIRMPGHVGFDLGGEVIIARKLRLSAVVRNALGEHYQDAIGFPVRSQAVTITVSVAL